MFGGIFSRGRWSGGFGPGWDFILYCMGLSLLGCLFAQPDTIIDWCEGRTVVGYGFDLSLTLVE